MSTFHSSATVLPTHPRALVSESPLPFRQASPPTWAAAASAWRHDGRVILYAPKEAAKRGAVTRHLEGWQESPRFIRMASATGRIHAPSHRHRAEPVAAQTSLTTGVVIKREAVTGTAPVIVVIKPPKDSFCAGTR